MRILKGIYVFFWQSTKLHNKPTFLVLSVVIVKQIEGISRKDKALWLHSWPFWPYYFLQLEQRTGVCWKMPYRMWRHILTAQCPVFLGELCIHFITLNRTVILPWDSQLLLIYVITVHVMVLFVQDGKKLEFNMLIVPELYLNNTKFISFIRIGLCASQKTDPRTTPPQGNWIQLKWFSSEKTYIKTLMKVQIG